MPYIQTMTNVGISGKKEQTIKQRMGEAIELIPGKSESWLMLSFHDDSHMYFRGEDEPCAICQVKLYGSASERAYDDLTGALTDILSEMGLAEAFTANANLRGLGSGFGNPYISSVLQKAKIITDENGTKAAAMTEVMVMMTSAGPSSRPKVIELNRPFFYMITETETGIPLFMGNVYEMK